MGLDVEIGDNKTIRSRPVSRHQTYDARVKTSHPKHQIPHAHTVGKGSKSHGFRRVAFGLALIGVSALVLFPYTTLQTLMMAFTALIIVQALLRCCAVMLTKKTFEIAPSSNPFSQTGPADWPLYTVLVPLKDEAHMVAGLLNTLSRLDYPRERLQIIFITEEDDPQTRRAVTTALRPPFEHVVVPRRGITGPRTKPYALNVAMQYACGEIITIYDAEDAPHPQQLKTAVRAFTQNPNWGALQAPLDYFNTNESWLAAQFGLEYSAQFHVWIPLMVRLGLPFPLGGTSNHIRRSALESVRYKDMFWDSYNVTEDADLSFRLSAKGWGIGYITPPTQEEAVAKLGPWTHQRTRWMKGFMQSWRVHMDAPLEPRGLQGVRRQLTLQLTLGSVLLAGFLHAPICFVLLAWVASQLITTGTIVLPPVVLMSLALGYGSGLLIGAAGAIRMGRPKLLLALPLMPLYWLCLAWPTYRAAIEYVRRPFYWAKTEHGLTSTQTPRPMHMQPTDIDIDNTPYLEKASHVWPAQVNPLTALTPYIPLSRPVNDRARKLSPHKDAAE